MVTGSGRCQEHDWLLEVAAAKMEFAPDREAVDPLAARGELESLARALAKKRPGAATSLREGLDDTLTLNRLGITGTLLKTLESTNPAESMIEVVRDHARRVKHWSSGEMALRWAAAGMLAAESQFRRVKGFRRLPDLARALEHAVGYDPDEHDLPATVTA